jgi:hypothetical protein
LRPHARLIIMKNGFDALMDFVCVGHGYCGSIHRDGTPLHVSLFIPDKGPVTADQFVEWVFLADRENPNVEPDRKQHCKDAIRAAFVAHMGGEMVDAERLRWSDAPPPDAWKTTPLALDDPQWARLSHAHGSAGDVPALLTALEALSGPAGQDAEPWPGLWSRLCHQGEVYEASYAAAPHIVTICGLMSGPVDFGFFLLPAAIEAARQEGRGPPVPPALAAAYLEAIRRLPRVLEWRLDEAWDRDFAVSAFGALAVAKGHHRLAEAVMNLDEDWIARIIGDERDEPA